MGMNQVCVWWGRDWPGLRLLHPRARSPVPRPSLPSPRFHHHVAFTPAPLLDGEPVLMRAVHSSACPQGTSHHRPITPGARAAAPTTSPHSFPSLPTSSFFLSIKELRGFLRPPTEQKKEFLRVLEVCSIFKAPRWT